MLLIVGFAGWLRHLERLRPATCDARMERDTLALGAKACLVGPRTWMGWRPAARAGWSGRSPSIARLARAA